MNTFIYFIISLISQTTLSMRALSLTQISLFGVQIDFWTSSTHQSLNCIWIIPRNLIANWLHSPIWRHLQIWVERAVWLSGTPALPVTISLPSAICTCISFRTDSFTSYIGPFIMKTICSWAESFANALAEWVTPLSTLTVIGGDAMAWSPLVVGVNMAAATEFGAVTKDL